MPPSLAAHGNLRKGSRTNRRLDQDGISEREVQECRIHDRALPRRERRGDL